MKYVKIGEVLSYQLASSHDKAHEEVTGQSQRQENWVKYQETIGYMIRKTHRKSIVSYEVILWPVRNKKRFKGVMSSIKY